MGKKKHQAKEDSINPFIPCLTEFGQRVARGEASDDEIKFMSRIVDVAERKGEEALRRKLLSLGMDAMRLP